MGPLLSDVKIVSIAPALVDGTLSVLREFGRARCEGLVLWVGQVKGKIATVNDVWVPRQRSVMSEEGVGYFVSSEELFAMNRELSDAKLRLIAQVHSHPGRAFHSETDDAYAIVTADGGLSLVVPNFGDAPADPVKWAAYRLRKGQWTELSRREARSLFPGVEVEDAG